MSFSISEFQEMIKQRDYDPEKCELYFMKLVEEVWELGRAMRKKLKYEQWWSIKNTIDEEIYDIIYYVLAIANLYDVDFDEAMMLKEKINDKRYWRAS